MGSGRVGVGSVVDSIGNDLVSKIIKSCPICVTCMWSNPIPSQRITAFVPCPRCIVPELEMHKKYTNSMVSDTLLYKLLHEFLMELGAQKIVDELPLWLVS